MYPRDDLWQRRYFREMATTQRYPVEAGRVCIDLKLKHINQLFDSLDPSPFLERDLDHNAVEYIVSATMEHPLRTPLLLRINVAEAESPSLDGKTVADAIHNHFLYSAELMRKKNRRVLRQSQYNFVIATIVLIVCLTIAHWIDVGVSNAFMGMAMREGLIILGWVAMWRPFDMFLYSWWPQIEMRRVYRKLSNTPVEMVTQP
jgi:hypothetical protein